MPALYPGSAWTVPNATGSNITCRALGRWDSGQRVNPLSRIAHCRASTAIALRTYPAFSFDTAAGARPIGGAGRTTCVAP